MALPLSAREIAVHGIELSLHMAEQLLGKPGADVVPVAIGDMTTIRVPGTLRLVYLVANTIMNVTTQDEQLAVFANAAAHLEPGGCFVVEVIVPQLRRVPPGEAARVFTLDPDHVFSLAFSITQRDVVPSAEPDADANPVPCRWPEAPVGRQARRCRERTARLPLA